MKWLQESLQDGNSHRYSSKRLSMLMAVTTLCICALALSAAACLGREVGEPMWAVCVAMSGLAGGAYIGGKVAEARRPRVDTAVFPGPYSPPMHGGE